ncbi:siderophore ABC transporter substrate-binding protein [Gulosibacter sediminis]|uniref:siderophore ABC transporter substrate-binding protein n=1 Tax=Gulosibacter sediminis TaxID=1729695 RepID=UPI0024A7C45B|nr:ABC transporter substrate-binding protein [Gulosibacter sediminis]
MRTPRLRLLGVVSAIAASLTLAACSTGAADTDATSAAGAEGTITVEDNNGTQTVKMPAQSIVALDNRTFETLQSWGVELAAAPLDLMPETIDYKTDESIVNIGNHREPNLEAIAAVEPELVIMGQRFTDYEDEIAELVPDATIINLEPREGEDFAEELKRQTTVLGELFGMQDEATALNNEFDAAYDRVAEADPADATFMAVNTSGGQIGYLAPHVGRTLGVLFDWFDFTPALVVEGASDDHEGDEVSVEAIAESNPDWILVMDRDAAVAADEEGYQPGADLIAESEALQQVPAVQKDQIVVMPADTYTNEGIQTYTEYLNQLADAFDAAS